MLTRLAVQLRNQAAAQTDRCWLFVDGASSFGGHEVMLLRLIEELRRQRQIVPRLMSRAGTKLRDKAGPIATSISLPVLPQARGLRGRCLTALNVLRDAHSFLKVLKIERPSLCIVAEGCLLAQPLFAILCRIVGVRVVIYIPMVERATDVGFRSGPIRDWIVRHGYANLPNAWIVLTHEQASQFTAWARVRRPILALTNAVAPQIEALSRDTNADPPLKKDHPWRVLVMGRLDMHQKGLGPVIDYLQRGVGIDNVRVSLVGEGPAHSELHQRIRESSKLAAVLTLLPWSDTVEAMRAHDVLLIASRFEGVPLVMLEAMALGLPVVSSDLAGTRSFLPPSCLFPFGDLAKAFEIIAALRDSRVRRPIVEQNRATFAARASGTAFAAAVADLSRELDVLSGAHARASEPPRDVDRSGSLNTTSPEASDVLVSVYIPTKNRCELLQRAVASVLAQTHAAIELIVVNDGSTDATRACLDQLRRDDPRIVVIHNERSHGAPRSRNLAICAARGEFITGLDDDDQFHPERVAALLHRWRELQSTGASFSGLYTQDLISQGDRGTATAKIARVEYEDLFFYNSIGNQIFTRRNYLIEAGMFDEQMPAWQDLDTFMRLLRRFGPAHLLDRPLYVLDMEPRADRISMGSKQRILSAYERLIAKLAHHPAALKQALFLQVFGRLYGFKLGPADLREFLRYGIHARTLRILAGVVLRQAGMR